MGLRAHSEEHRTKISAQVRERHIPADLHAQPEFHAAFRQRIDATLDNVLLQFECRNDRYTRSPPGIINDSKTVTS